MFYHHIEVNSVLQLIFRDPYIEKESIFFLFRNCAQYLINNELVEWVLIEHRQILIQATSKAKMVVKNHPLKTGTF